MPSPASRDDQAALIADWAFMATVVEAAGNLVFQLIMNSVRELYLPKIESFAAWSSDATSSCRSTPAGPGDRVQDADDAANAIGELAAAQERRMHT